MPPPWTEVLPVKLKEEFVLLALEPGACMAKLCRQYEMSRQNGYKWLRRYREGGIEGLHERSRRPEGSAVAVSGEMVLQILELRQRRGWGPKKLRELLRRRARGRGTQLPSVRTIARIVARGGLVKKRKRLSPQGGADVHRRAAPTVTVAAPNDLWTVDFKGWWSADNGDRCEPLTVRDAHSRYALCAVLLAGTSTALVRPQFEQLFARYGRPRAILSDNGPPFASSTAPWGLTELSAWWVSLRIEVLHSRPGCPQDNGGHERIHLDMVPLQTESAPTRQAQQVLLDQWGKEFNHVRPHEALGMKTPAQVYLPKARRPSPKLVTRSYPTGAAIRRVLTNGHFWYGGRTYFLSRALRGHDVALVQDPRLGSAMATIMFHHLAVGELDLDGGTKVQPISTQNRQPPATVADRAPPPP
jgi:putative transposase